MGQDLDRRLSELAKLCGCERKQSSRPRYSEEVKDLVRELASAKVAVPALASAAGVSAGSVRNWLSDAPSGVHAAGVKVLKVDDGSGEGPDCRRMVLMIRAADYEVAVYSRERGRL